MEKIIRNFITNAVKISPYGGNVTIRLLACLEPRQEQEETTADLLPQQRKQLLQHQLPHQQHIELRSCVQGFSAEALAVTQIFLHPYYRSCSRLRDWCVGSTLLWTAFNWVSLLFSAVVVAGRKTQTILTILVDQSGLGLRICKILAAFHGGRMVGVKISLQPNCVTDLWHPLSEGDFSWNEWVGLPGKHILCRSAHFLGQRSDSLEHDRRRMLFRTIVD